MSLVTAHDDDLRISMASPKDFFALLKPRVMSLVVFTALAGMLIEPTHVHPLLGFISLLCIAVGAGASGALNMWYDADIDAVMGRTALRPVPSGRVTPGEALGFGLTLSAFSVLTLGLVSNWLAASLLAVLLYGFLRDDWLQAVLGGIALGMSMLPQEFPLVLSAFMVMGAWRLSQARVLTRRAAAIEMLGSATVLCTDKTGLVRAKDGRRAQHLDGRGATGKHAGLRQPPRSHHHECAEHEGEFLGQHRHAERNAAQDRLQPIVTQEAIEEDGEQAGCEPVRHEAERQHGEGRKRQAEAKRLAGRHAARWHRAQRRATHHGVDVGIVPHVQRAGRAGTHCNAEQRDETEERVDMGWLDQHAGERGEDHEGHDTRFEEREEILRARHGNPQIVVVCRDQTHEPLSGFTLLRGEEGGARSATDEGMPIQPEGSQPLTRLFRSYPLPLGAGL